MWPLGKSYTVGHWEVTTNPDKTQEKIYVHEGVFYFYQFNLLGNKNWPWEFYAGFRPTAPWGQGYGNEGDLGLGWWGRWKKRNNCGNLGFAFRPRKKKAVQ
jgi:hypothetical protein